MHSGIWSSWGESVKERYMKLSDDDVKRLADSIRTLDVSVRLRLAADLLDLDKRRKGLVCAIAGTVIDELGQLGQLGEAHVGGAMTEREPRPDSLRQGRIVREKGFCGHVTAAEPSDVACILPIGHDDGAHEACRGSRVVEPPAVHDLVPRSLLSWVERSIAFWSEPGRLTEAESKIATNTLRGLLGDLRDGAHRETRP